MLSQPFYIVSALLHTLSPISCLGQQLYYVSHFCVVSVISCFASHFNVLSAFDFVTAILMFCQIFYIYCQSFFGDIFFWLCVLQVYYLDNLLSNISVPAGTPRCQFFTSDVIDRISNLDRDVSRDGSVSFGKLLVSKTCFLPTFRHFCHFIVKTL
jgi:hypothetical protein